MTTHAEIDAPSRSAASSPAGRGLRTALWAAQAGLAAVFALAGATKAFAPLDRVHHLIPWSPDVPTALLRFVGWMEVLAALGLILPSLFGVRPRLTPYAALGLIAVMIPASAFHAFRSEPTAIALNGVLAAVAAFVAWGRLQAAPIGVRA